MDLLRSARPDVVVPPPRCTGQDMRLRSGQLLADLFRHRKQAATTDEIRDAWLAVWAAWRDLQPHRSERALRDVFRRSSGARRVWGIVNLVTYDDARAAEAPPGFGASDRYGCLPFEVRMRAALRWTDGADALELLRTVHERLDAPTAANTGWRRHTLCVLQRFLEEACPEGRVRDWLERAASTEVTTLRDACARFAAHHPRGMSWLLPALHVLGFLRACTTADFRSVAATSRPRVQGFQGRQGFGNDHLFHSCHTKPCPCSPTSLFPYGIVQPCFLSGEIFATAQS